MLSSSVSPVSDAKQMPASHGFGQPLFLFVVHVSRQSLHHSLECGDAELGPEPLRRRLALCDALSDREQRKKANNINDSLHHDYATFDIEFVERDCIVVCQQTRDSNIIPER